MGASSKARWPCWQLPCSAGLVACGLCKWRGETVSPRQLQRTPRGRDWPAVPKLRVLGPPRWQKPRQNPSHNPCHDPSPSHASWHFRFSCSGRSGGRLCTGSHWRKTCYVCVLSSVGKVVHREYNSVGTACKTSVRQCKAGVKQCKSSVNQ